MFRKLLLVGASALAGAAALSAVFSVSAQDGPPPPPSAGTSIASGLSATGGTIGPDGALYVPIGGEAATAIAVPEEFVEVAGTDTVYFGTTGSVARVDVGTGDVTTYADGLPVTSFEAGEPGSGPTDVAFMDGTLYVLVTSSVSPFGGAAAGYPNGVYRLNADDTWTIIADISEFNDDNPVDFADAVPGGNPFAIEVRGSQFIVSDGNWNRLLTITKDGDISILSQFENIVPTGLATTASGPVLNTWFSPFPHNPGASFLMQVGFPTGSTTQVADTWAQLIDVEFGPGGKTYVLQFGDQQLDENGPPPPGRLLLLDDGELVPLVDGMILPTSVSFAGDTAYITSLTGEVWEIPGVSALTPIAVEPAPAPTTGPAPTATVPSGTVTPPDTGTGGADGGPANAWIALLLLAAGAATCFGLVKAASRR